MALGLTITSNNSGPTPLSAPARRAVSTATVAASPTSSARTQKTRPITGRPSIPRPWSAAESPHGLAAPPVSASSRWRACLMGRRERGGYRYRGQTNRPARAIVLLRPRPSARGDALKLRPPRVTKTSAGPVFSCLLRGESGGVWASRSRLLRCSSSCSSRQAVWSSRSSLDRESRARGLRSGTRGM